MQFTNAMQYLTHIPFIIFVVWYLTKDNLNNTLNLKTPTIKTTQHFKSCSL